MITNFKFQMIPDQALYPEYPTFELFVKKKITGLIWTSEEYAWSCLPGYTKENMGSVEVCDYTDVGGKGYGFYLYSRQLDVDDPVKNPCYGILWDVPKNYTIGATGSASIHYGGSKVKHLQEAGIADVLYGDWKLLNVF